MDKACSTCRISKFFSDFSKNRAQKDGYHNQCKVCAGISINSTRREYQSNKSNKYNPTLEEEVELLERVKAGDGDAYLEIRELVKGFIRWRAFKHRSIFDETGYLELMDYLYDKLYYRVTKFSKKPWKRKSNRDDKRGSLLSYLSICAKYDCIHFVEKWLDHRWWQNKRHIRKDRTKVRLTPIEKQEYHSLILSGESIYKIARMFSITAFSVNAMRTKLTKPEKYRAFLDKRNIYKAKWRTSRKEKGLKVT